MDICTSSISVTLMKGENDDHLTWPFTGTVLIELLNQLEDKNHHKVAVELPADHGQLYFDLGQTLVRWWFSFFQMTPLSHWGHER